MGSCIFSPCKSYIYFSYIYQPCLCFYSLCMFLLFMCITIPYLCFHSSWVFPLSVCISTLRLYSHSLYVFLLLMFLFYLYLIFYYSLYVFLPIKHLTDFSYIILYIINNLLYLLKLHKILFIYNLLSPGPGFFLFKFESRAKYFAVFAFPLVKL